MNLTITGPNGLPATWTYIDVWRGYPWRNPWEVAWGHTEDGNITLQLGRGRHIAILQHYSAPKFVALYSFYVRENATFQVNIAGLTVPVNLVAVKPLVDRPFTMDAYFIVRLISYPDLWNGQIWFNVDTVGEARLHLPKNTRCSFAYLDNGAGYGLFVKNVLVKKVNATISFDASRTGLIKPIFIPPTSNLPIFYQELQISGKDLPDIEFWIYESWDKPLAITLGRYDMVAFLQHFVYEGGFRNYTNYFFDLGQQNVAGKKVRELVYGGDLKGFVKPSKNYYKVGENIIVDYWHEDAYRHKLVYAYTYVYDEDWNWVTGYYPPLNLTICDNEGSVESEVLEWYNPTETLYLYTKSFFAPGIYNVRIEYSPEPYQGAIVSFTQIVVK